jgi:hypothetical protein
MTEQTRYEKFVKDAHDDIDAFKADAHANEVYHFTRAVKGLQKLQHHMSCNTLINMFGDQLGKHLWEKFISQHNRNVLSWLSKLTDEYRFFILHELKYDKIFY